MTSRFVILAHTVNGGVHYDLMLQVEGREKLVTYQLARWPLEVGESCDCRRLDDHRRVYLEYEGEISGGRGVVARVAGGVWTGDLTLIPAEGEPVKLELTGTRATRTG